MKTKLRPLLSSFTKGGYDFCLLDRHGAVGQPSVALFQKINPEHVRWCVIENRPTVGDHFEVVLVQQSPEQFWAHSGVTTPAREGLPGREKDWGRLGWTFSSRSAAEQRFAEEAAKLDKAPKKKAKPLKRQKWTFEEPPLA
jgi:hypothetical protein